MLIIFISLSISFCDQLGLLTVNKLNFRVSEQSKQKKFKDFSRTYIHLNCVFHRPKEKLESLSTIVTQVSLQKHQQYQNAAHQC